MFMFGSLALEQFVDLLIEWPQYCNHILQISHFRIIHSVIVAFIKQALARISSGHTNVDGKTHASAVITNHSSAQATLGHVELSAAPASYNLGISICQCSFNKDVRILWMILTRPLLAQRRFLEFCL